MIKQKQLFWYRLYGENGSTVYVIATCASAAKRMSAQPCKTECIGEAK